jgi:UDP-N-acetylglucosamine 2-epimerase (non-hydrolysing)
MEQRRICLVAGARPNFMKIAPIVRAMRDGFDRLQPFLVHTGQHYDREMSQVFFEELAIPAPDYNIESGSGSHAEQTARIMVGFEKLCRTTRLDHVLVVGDVNSTLACSVTAKKDGIPISHVEAGLRSFDMSMPEEVNRIVTDALSDWLFCTEPSATENLVREGKSPQTIFLVGHVMIDTLLFHCDRLARTDPATLATTSFKKEFPRYGVVTLHRPSNVDDPVILRDFARTFAEIARDLPLVFPLHPRTKKNVERFGVDFAPSVRLTAPFGYMDFLNLWKDAAIVFTDSGGLQEETTALGVPCLTLRENTERPITVAEGTNTIVGRTRTLILEETKKILTGHGKAGKRPDLWDGRAAERIVGTLARLMV